MFPGREFDDLDAYRAAKKQRAERLAMRPQGYEKDATSVRLFV